MQPPAVRQNSYGGQAKGGVPDPLLGGGAAGASSASTSAKSRSTGTGKAPSRSRAKDHKPTQMPNIAESRLTASAQQAPLLGPKIADLVRSIDPTLTIEPAAEEQVLCLVDDFVDKVVKQSMRIAQHRSSRTLDVADIQLILSQQWGITVSPPAA